MDFEENDNIPELPSKTRRKKEMHALQTLGARLTRLSVPQLERLPLSDKLRNAVGEYKKLPNSHGARRRQMQYIGRLMRDFQLQDIEQEINEVLHPTRDNSRRNRQLETACNQVLIEGDDGINSLVERFAHLDRQVLRHFYLDYLKATREDTGEGLDHIHSKLTAYLSSELD